MPIPWLLANERRAMWLMAIVGFISRMMVAPFLGHKYDVRAYLTWTEYFQRNSLGSFYGATLSTPPDHLPGDLMIFAAIGRLAPWLFQDFSFESWYAELIIRLVPITSDILLGVIAYLFVRGRQGGPVGLLAAACIVFNPGLFTVSAIWGQWDSFAAVILLGTIMLALRGNTMIIWPLMMYQILIKPQYAVFGLLLALYLIRLALTTGPVSDERARKSLMHLARDIAIGVPLSLLAFAAICFPFGVGFPGQVSMQWTISERVSFAVNRYNDITLGAQNLWSLFGKRLGDPDSLLLVGTVTYSSAGRILLAAFVVIAIVTTVVRAPADWALLCGCFIAAMSIYSLPTRVHERYMMPTLVLILVMWPMARRLLPIAFGLTITYTVSLILAMWWDAPIRLSYVDFALALANLTLFGWAVAEMFRATRYRWKAPHSLITALKS